MGFLISNWEQGYFNWALRVLQTLDLHVHEKDLDGGAIESTDRKSIDLSRKYKAYCLVAIRVSEETQWENEFGSVG